MQLNYLSNLRRLNINRPSQICNRGTSFKNGLIGAGVQVHLLHRRFDQSAKPPRGIGAGFVQCSVKKLLLRVKVVSE